MLAKSIQHGKEHREEYHGSKRFDVSCRNHGGCPWCTQNHLRYQKVFKDIEASQEDETTDSE